MFVTNAQYVIITKSLLKNFIEKFRIMSEFITNIKKKL